MHLIVASLAPNLISSNPFTAFFCGVANSFMANKEKTASYNMQCHEDLAACTTIGCTSSKPSNNLQQYTQVKVPNHFTAFFTMFTALIESVQSYPPRIQLT